MNGYEDCSAASTAGQTGARARSSSFVQRAGLVLTLAAAVVVLCVAFKDAARSSSSQGSYGGMLESPATTGPALKARAQLSDADGVKVYLGNGCFWARQHALVAVEQASAAFGPRSNAQVTALAGYAGSKEVGPGGLVCYHGGPSGSVYEGLGDCEVVQVALNRGQEVSEMKALLQSYFASFVSLGSEGMQRPDPQDAGAQYRSAIGIPGGIDGPLMSVVRDCNLHAMRLLPGKGGDDDELNTVWIYDSGAYRFHRAEEYHQFYKGPTALKAEQKTLGRINPTGCPENSWR